MTTHAPAVEQTPAGPASNGPRIPHWVTHPVTWSSLAGWRALRATILIPGLFALTFKVAGNSQIASFAVFGGFANLVLATFSGTRRNRFAAHISLALGGCVLVTVGTAVAGKTALAGLVSLAVAFVVLLAGVAGPNVAAGGLAALLAFVLPAASAGHISMVPDRIAGWAMASMAAGMAVVATTPRQTALRLWDPLAGSARALSREAAAVVTGDPAGECRAASHTAEQRLRSAFDATPVIPSGLDVTAQALGALVEMLEWVGQLLSDTTGELDSLQRPGAEAWELVGASADVLGQIADMLDGGNVLPDVDRLERLRRESSTMVRHLDGDPEANRLAVHRAFHATSIAVAVRSAAVEAMIVAGQADPELIEERRYQWLPGAGAADAPMTRFVRRRGTAGFPAAVASAIAVGVRHAGLRSVWVRNSARGAVAVAAAVAIADALNVQHGFWVVLGTLAVLRTTASSTGSTALRAILGTVIGFAVGAGLVWLIGTNTVALWIALPIAVMVAGYAPGMAPFAVGQAAFTVLLVVLYNILAPVGWKVGEIRVEDILLGCAISLVVGATFWPRGASAVVAADLDDAFESSARFLVEAAGVALGLTEPGPDDLDRMYRLGRNALAAGIRLDDAIRAYLTEQGTKPVQLDDLWALVGSAQRVRLTGSALADLPSPSEVAPDAEILRDRARLLAAWFDEVGGHLRRGRPADLVPLGPFSPLSAEHGTSHQRACQLFVAQHLRHLHDHHRDVADPAIRLRAATSRPWWRPATGVPAGPLPSGPGAGSPEPDRALG